MAIRYALAAEDRARGRVVAALGSVLALAAWDGPDGPMIGLGGEDGGPAGWELNSGQPVGGPMTGHTGSVTALVAWDGPDGPMPASAAKMGRSGAGTQPLASRSAVP